MSISTLAAYDINAFIKADSELQTIAGKTIDIYPIIGPGGETAPFAVYYVSSTIPNLEAWWNRYDTISYTVYDTDINRLYKIGERMIELLSKGHVIADADGKEGTDTRLLSTYFTGSEVMDSIERDGWFTMNLDFVVYYTAK